MAFKNKFGKFFGFGSSKEESVQPATETAQETALTEEPEEFNQQDDVTYTQIEDAAPIIEEPQEEALPSEEVTQEPMQEPAEENIAETIEKPKGFFAKLKAGLQ